MLCGDELTESYSYVEGNVPNLTDPSGMIPTTLGKLLGQFNSTLSLNMPMLLESISCLSGIGLPSTTEDEQCLYDCAIRSRTTEEFDQCYNDCITLLNGLSCTGGFKGTPASSTPTTYILFSGSGPEGINAPGPTPQFQLPAWVNAFAGNTFQYLGSKADQATNALSRGYRGNLAVVGYSAGADTAVMFAEAYTWKQLTTGGSGRITDLVILGGTMSGTMLSGTDLENRWMCTLSNLINFGTDVYVLNDDGFNRKDPRWEYFNSIIRTNGTGTYTYAFDRREHYQSGFPGTGTNNDPQLQIDVFSWITSN